MKLAIVLAIILWIQSATPQCDCSMCECIDGKCDCSACTEHDCTECDCFQAQCNECDCETCSESTSANETSTSATKPTEVDESGTSSSEKTAATKPTEVDESDTSFSKKTSPDKTLTSGSKPESTSSVMTTEFQTKPTSASNATTITIAAIASITIIVIAVIILLTLACYWKYRLKTIRERNQAETEKNNASSNLQDMSNPVYSVIADDQAIVASLPPILPQNGTPYYQEIMSDQLGADYEMPMKSISSAQHEEATKEEDSEVLKH